MQPAPPSTSPPPPRLRARRGRVLTVAAAVIAVLVTLGLGPRVARADNVEQLIKQLATGSDYKVRLSAATSLAKLGDDRAIGAFIKALKSDSEKTVRAAAALGLSKVITTATSTRLIEQATTALETAAKSDKDAFVKKQAKKALAKLEALGGGGTSAAGGGVYVNIGEMSAETDSAAEMKALMRKTTEKTFSKNAGGMTTKWRGGKAPTKKELKDTQAFYVDGTLNELSTKAQGSATLVSCKVSMLIATYPEKSMFGFLNGQASVQASKDAKDIELAKGDCVAAVIEDLTIKKIIPTIKTKAGL